jgi:hypothetical protein
MENACDFVFGKSRLLVLEKQQASKDRQALPLYPLKRFQLGTKHADCQMH